MDRPTLLSRIARKGAAHEAIAHSIAGRRDAIAQLIGGLASAEPRVKYGCAKVLTLVSQQNPAALYPMFDVFLPLLEHENSFLKWNAIAIVANLAAADTKGMIDRILPRYLKPIGGPVMITAANTIAGAATIALARPDLADNLARAILGVEEAKYDTAECRNVAIGHAISALGRFFQHIRRQKPVLEFVSRQTANTRNATKKKAEAFLKKYGSPEEPAQTKQAATATSTAG